MTDSGSPAPSAPRVSRSRAGWLTAALAVLLAGLAIVVFTWDRADDPALPSSPPLLTPPPDAPFLTLPVSGTQGVGGAVTLYGLGGQTLVVLDLQGAGAAGAARLRDGECGAVPERDEWLLVAVGAEGTSRTLVDVPLGLLVTGNYVVDLPRADLVPAEEVCVAITDFPVNAAGTPVDLNSGMSADSAGMAGDGTGGSGSGSVATPSPSPIVSAAASPAASPAPG